MLRKVDRLILRVPALASAVRFYRDTLGLQLVHEDKSIATFRYADDDGELVLHTDPDLPAEAIYHRVEDVRAALYDRRRELKLNFSTPPTQIARGYRAAIKDPFGNTILILDRSADLEGAVGVEDTRAATASLFPGVETRLPAKREALIHIYEQVGRTADDLPYTPAFESLYEAYAAQHADPKPTRGETWRHLLNLRKAGKLPRLGEAKSAPPPIDAEERQQLKQLVGKQIGRRDRLPYTDEFVAMVDAFNQHRPRPFSPHLVWRLVATLAK